MHVTWCNKARQRSNQLLFVVNYNAKNGELNYAFNGDCSTFKLFKKSQFRQDQDAMKHVFTVKV